ncbi:MAG: type I restriction enzyme HsdR N-terminal domain-containing protein [Chitinophagaceae bacterium]|nr:type I restriction enzyme HsdR N-terminal domain-containing protein [Chitinophagaceae bacterium]
MLTTSKKSKLLNAVKLYSKKFLNNKVSELDESGTRLMINSFLTDVLGYQALEEVKTEYMIRGTYADYVVQLKGVRHFLVEVKALSLELSDKHLRQAINYGANEGIEWALLTNGRNFEFYKILFNKPIEWKLIFSFDLSDSSQIKECIELMQYLHKESVANKGLTLLWNKNCALDPLQVAGLLYAPAVTNFIKRTLKAKYKSKFSDDDIRASVSRVIHEHINLEHIKPLKGKKEKRKPGKPETETTEQNEVVPMVQDENKTDMPVNEQN